MTAPLIAVASIREGHDRKLLFLKKLENHLFQWFKEDQPTDIQGDFWSQAICLAYRKWKSEDFQMLPCGMVFTLPERDEHGNNALFYQMAKSLESMNGIYYDENFGSNCIVQQIPTESKEIYLKLKSPIDL